MKRFFKKGDFVILACALLLCAVMFLPRLFSKSGNLVARVYESGELTYEISLDNVNESREIKINGAVLLVENGSVKYLTADCPDKICVKSGKLSLAGDTAACIPGKTVVTVVRAKESNENFDVMTY